MNHKYIKALVLVLCLLSVTIIMSGCETIRFGIETDFGTFTYQLPQTKELPKPTFNK